MEITFRKSTSKLDLSDMSVVGTCRYRYILIMQVRSPFLLAYRLIKKKNTEPVRIVFVWSLRHAPLSEIIPTYVTRFESRDVLFCSVGPGKFELGYFEFPQLTSNSNLFPLDLPCPSQSCFIIGYFDSPHYFKLISVCLGLKSTQFISNSIGS